MKILFASQYYPPESNAPANRVSEMAREWVRLGHEVEVLTAFPHHPHGVIPVHYKGYLHLNEELDGVGVKRTYVYVAPNKGIVKRSLSYISWMLSAIVIGSFKTARPDVVVATSPQFLCAVAGYVVSLLKRRPFVMEVRDLWPESIVAVGALKEGFAVSILRWMERFLYRAADRIVIVSPGFWPHFDELGIDRGKISYLPNGVDLDLFRPGAPKRDVYAENGIEGKLRILYAGTVGMAHGLELMLEAGERFKDDPEVELVVVGDGARRAELTAETARRGLRNVHFLGMQPREAMPDWILGATALVVHLRRMPLFEKVLPSKLFEYMGCGKPVLMGVAGAAADIVDESGCGWRFTPEDVEEFVGLVRRARENPSELRQAGERGRSYVEKNYDRRELARRYVSEILEPIVTGGRRG